jgi:DNA-binding transcriptional LysR family regulator
LKTSGEHFPLRPPSTRRLRVFIGTSDYAELVLLPGIMARLGREAPGVEVRVLAVKDDYGSELAAGKLDVVLMPPPPMKRARAFGTNRF